MSKLKFLIPCHVESFTHFYFVITFLTLKVVVAHFIKKKKYENLSIIRTCR